MKKLVASLLTLTFLFATTTAFAAETGLAEDDVSMVNEFLSEALPYVKPMEISDESLEFASFWNKAILNHYIYVDTSGYIVILPEAKNLVSNISLADDYFDTVAFMNQSIRLGLIAINAETLECYNRPLTQETLDKIAEEPTSSTAIPYAVPHDCGYPSLNAGYLAWTNYQELKNYYDRMTSISLTTPNFDPYTPTLTYWISRVKSGGAWDYKVVSGYAPYNKVFCMGYGGQTGMHQTSEWLGNYNYGYTGSILFPLSVLHAGSFAVSGFDPKDSEDWPAIDEGYYDAA